MAAGHGTVYGVWLSNLVSRLEANNDLSSPMMNARMQSVTSNVASQPNDRDHPISTYFLVGCKLLKFERWAKPAFAKTTFDKPAFARFMPEMGS